MKIPVNSFDLNTSRSAYRGMTRKRENAVCDSPSYAPYRCSYTAIVRPPIRRRVGILHRLQENVFERITFKIEPPDLNPVCEREAVQIAYLHRLLHDQFNP